MMRIVVDSCVLISRLVLDESNHLRARSFFAEASVRGDELISPATVLWDLGARFVHPIKVKTNVVTDDSFVIPIKFLPVTPEMFFENQQTHLRFDGRALSVVRSKIRGPDSVFLSFALAERVRLVTFDDDLLAGGALFGVTTLTVEQYLSSEFGPETAPVPTDREVFAAINRRVSGDQGDD